MWKNVITLTSGDAIMRFTSSLLIACVISHQVSGGVIPSNQIYTKNNDISNHDITRNKRSVSCCSTFMCLCGKQEYCDRTEKSCKRCHVCPAGSRATEECGDGNGQLAKCDPCKRNEYSSGGLETICHHCTDCGQDLGRTTLHSCDGKRDSVCGPCVPWYFDHTNLGPKVACSKESTTESPVWKPETTQNPTNPSTSPDVTTVLPKEAALPSAYSTPPNTTTYDTDKYSKKHTSDVLVPVEVITVIGVLFAVCFLVFAFRYCKKTYKSRKANNDECEDQNCTELNISRTQKFEYNNGSAMLTSSSSEPNSINQAKLISNEVTPKRPLSLIVSTIQQKKAMMKDPESGYTSTSDTSVAVMEGGHSEEASPTEKNYAQPPPRNHNSFESEHSLTNHQPADTDYRTTRVVNVPVVPSENVRIPPGDLDDQEQVPFIGSAPVESSGDVRGPTANQIQDSAIPNPSHVYNITYNINAPVSGSILSGQSDVKGDMNIQAPDLAVEGTTPDAASDADVCKDNHVLLPSKRRTSRCLHNQNICNVLYRKANRHKPD